MKIWRELLGVQAAVIQDVVFEAHALVFHVRPYIRVQKRCGECGDRCPGYDRGGGRRRWRHLDFGHVPVFLEAESPRVQCPVHGVTVAQVPWARHGARFTRAYEDTAAWLATKCSRAAIEELMRTTWRSIGRMIKRVKAELSGGVDPCKNLRRIGIDEISYRKGQRYIIVVVDHDSGDLVWAAPGRNKEVVNAFFDACGDPGAIELVSCDAASWIQNVVRERCPNATICMDPFHVVQWCTDGLDDLRRDEWRSARTRGMMGKETRMKGARWALLKNADNLNPAQERILEALEELNAGLYRGYLLKEQLRAIFQARADQVPDMLDGWIKAAEESHLHQFERVARAVSKQRDNIIAAVTHGLSNARIESMNTRIRLITRRAYGFHSAQALISLAMLSLGGLCPSLPGRPS